MTPWNNCGWQQVTYRRISTLWWISFVWTEQGQADVENLQRTYDLLRARESVEVSDIVPLAAA